MSGHSAFEGSAGVAIRDVGPKFYPAGILTLSRNEFNWDEI